MFTPSCHHSPFTLARGYDLITYVVLSSITSCSDEFPSPPTIPSASCLSLRFPHTFLNTSSPLISLLLLPFPWHHLTLPSTQHHPHFFPLRPSRWFSSNQPILSFPFPSPPSHKSLVARFSPYLRFPLSQSPTLPSLTVSPVSTSHRLPPPPPPIGTRRTELVHSFRSSRCLELCRIFVLSSSLLHPFAFLHLLVSFLISLSYCSHYHHPPFASLIKSLPTTRFGDDRLPSHVPLARSSTIIFSSILLPPFLLISSSFVPLFLFVDLNPPDKRLQSLFFSFVFNPSPIDHPIILLLIGLSCFFFSTRPLRAHMTRQTDRRFNTSFILPTSPFIASNPPLPSLVFFF